MCVWGEHQDVSPRLADKQAAFFARGLPVKVAQALFPNVASDESDGAFRVQGGVCIGICTYTCQGMCFWRPYFKRNGFEPDVWDYPQAIPTMALFRTKSIYVRFPGNGNEQQEFAHKLVAKTDARR